MVSRLNLQKELEEILGNRNVYFQPPETIKLQYPCIIYNLDKIVNTNADNIAYSKNRRYQITLIHKDPDNDVIDKLTNLQTCSMDRVYNASNLYHYVFTLFY